MDANTFREGDTTDVLLSMPAPPSPGMDLVGSGELLEKPPLDEGDPLPLPLPSDALAVEVGVEGAVMVKMGVKLPPPPPP